MKVPVKHRKIYVDGLRASDFRHGEEITIDTGVSKVTGILHRNHTEGDYVQVTSEQPKGPVQEEAES